MITQSPRCTCPPSVALLASTQWLPTRQSCATCEYAMNRLSSPMRVTPSSLVVPRFRVTNSRITLRSPISRRVGSPLYFLSCGAEPTEANWKIWLSAPSRVGPWTTACGPMRVFAPISTPGPITAYAPDLDARAELGLGRDQRRRRG